LPDIPAFRHDPAKAVITGALGGADTARLGGPPADDPGPFHWDREPAVCGHRRLIAENRLTKQPQGADVVLGQQHAVADGEGSLARPEVSVSVDSHGLAPADLKAACRAVELLAQLPDSALEMRHMQLRRLLLGLTLLGSASRQSLLIRPHKLGRMVRGVELAGEAVPGVLGAAGFAGFGGPPRRCTRHPRPRTSARRRTF
jgi:hypothetical protein